MVINLMQSREIEFDDHDLLENITEESALEKQYSEILIKQLAHLRSLRVKNFKAIKQDRAWRVKYTLLAAKQMSCVYCSEIFEHNIHIKSEIMVADSQSVADELERNKKIEVSLIPRASSFNLLFSALEEIQLSSHQFQVCDKCSRLINSA